MQGIGHGEARDLPGRGRSGPLLPVLHLPQRTPIARRGSSSRAWGTRTGAASCYEQPFFWAIDKSPDATVDARHRDGSARRHHRRVPLRVVADVRAASFTGGVLQRARSAGRPRAADRQLSAEDTDRPRIAGSWRAGIARSRGRTRTSTSTCSASPTDNFLREIRAFASTVSTDIQIRSTRSQRSRLGLVQTWDARRRAGRDDVVPGPHRPAGIRARPLAAPRRPSTRMPFFGGLLVGRLPGEFVNFHREEGYQRPARRPRARALRAVPRLGAYVRRRCTGQVRETAYHLTGRRSRSRSSCPTNGRASPRRSCSTATGLSAPRHRHDPRARPGAVAARDRDRARVYDFPYLGLTASATRSSPRCRYLFVPQVGAATPRPQVAPPDREPDA